MARDMFSFLRRGAAATSDAAEAMRSYDAGEMDEDDSDFRGDPQAPPDEAAHLDPFRGPALDGHHGPAQEAYAVFAGDTMGMRTPEHEARLRELYAAAGDEAQAKGVRLDSRVYDPGSLHPRGLYDEEEPDEESLARLRRNIESVR